jgi:hypothetical protein
MLTPKQLEIAADSIAGTCDTIESALEFVTNDNFTTQDLTQFEEYLCSIEQYCCEDCGWWGYPGEIECDCNTN